MAEKKPGFRVRCAEVYEPDHATAATSPLRSGAGVKVVVPRWTTTITVGEKVFVPLDEAEAEIARVRDLGAGSG